MNITATTELSLCHTVHGTKNQVMKCIYRHVSPDDLKHNQCSATNSSAFVRTAAFVNTLLLEDKGTVCRDTHSKSKMGKCSFYHPVNRIITTLEGKEVYIGYDETRMRNKLCNGYHATSGKMTKCNRIHLHPIIAILYSCPPEYIKHSDANLKWFC